MTILAMSIGGKVSVSRHAVVAVFTTVLVLLLTSNSATLRANVVAQVGQRESRELYESAVRLGIFRGVPDGSIVMSNEADPNTWINGYFTAWLGGPENLIFVRNDDELKDQCLKNDCDIRPRFDLHSYIDSYDQPWITLRNRPMELAQTGKIRGPVIRKVAGKRDAVLRATDCAARGPSTWGRKYAVVACSAE
jgi:hypothetical protein